jgi:hypothetical protein
MNSFVPSGTTSHLVTCSLGVQAGASCTDSCSLQPWVRGPQSKGAPLIRLPAVEQAGLTSA